ncbi:hypothetical protein N658DRAFT_492994 [Parathielavia hyrcaniae]|uniref:HypA protein n=1 Tax=Parathielavia hyrcaniae TaxID=113614 RepID=A0AAN6T5K1_9PEZI|nr:hypothetical protein N658DRAFT_492994 [Parathielavia hyrcaniae]
MRGIHLLCNQLTSITGASPTFSQRLASHVWMRPLARATSGLRTTSITRLLHIPSSPRMASATDLPYKMHVTPDNTGLWHVKQTDEAAKKASELLQEDMEKHHVFFNLDGFHNHIPHHILALYGTAAPTPALQAAYDHNASYQRPALPPHSTTSTTATITFHPWPAAAKAYLGKEEYYPDFLRFFQSEIKALGSWQTVVTRYLFSNHDDDDNDEMLVRLFAGFLHPLIQLMYGVEWRQEAIVAEALAQAAVHGGDIGEFLREAEQRASSSSSSSSTISKSPSVMELVEEVRGSERLRAAARNGDANKVRDGVLVRAREDMVALAARVRVRPDEVEERTAEMFDAALFVAAAAALVKEKEGKVPKFDFFLMHHVNASPIFVTLNAQDWIPAETKARLLEWKIRMDLLQYAARGVPELSQEKLAAYQPKKPDAGGSLAEIIARLHSFRDDGHAIKLGRATVVCHNICKAYEKDGGKDWLKVKGDDMWKRVCHLVVDSVEAPGPNWVRSCGFDEAWKDVPDL